MLDPHVNSPSSGSRSNASPTPEDLESSTDERSTRRPQRDTRLRNRLFWALLAAALITGFWLI
ncbi:hypothetical protein [Cobetia marina]|uniref:hypothetical protein n=1 Tax=Cobetia marina TaxID=28258 RepID=UPI00114256FC|nr:hypothetical protein [Cobetia marina]GED43918.1 hypothetical protein HHA02_32470 [Cobetia marina]